MKHKSYIIVLSCFLFLPLIGGCNKKDTEIVNTKVCSLKNDPMSSSWTFALNKDNRIVSMDLEADINYEKIKKAHPKYTKQDCINNYITYKKQLSNDLNYIKNKYSMNKPWFNGSVTYDDSYLSVSSEYHFLVSHELFNYELEDGFLNEFGLKQFYNKDKSGFYYDIASIKSNLFNNRDIICKDAQNNKQKIN